MIFKKSFNFTVTTRRRTRRASSHPGNAVNSIRIHKMLPHLGPLVAIAFCSDQNPSGQFFGAVSLFSVSPNAF
jgi:hypothetical protein